VSPVIPRLDDEPVLIIVGSLVPEKNQTFMLDVFHALHKQYGRGWLWVVGDGPLRNSLESQARELGLVNQIKFLGYQPDALSYIRSADVLVLPSKIEGLPAVLLEAMACGVPVLTSAVGGIPEVVIDRETGILMRDWRVESYVEGIVSILSDERFRSGIVARAQQLVSSNYPLNTIAERFRETYQQLQDKTDT
jgi:glycosyltransferase involved in cell wall biosynthesis